jgi:hypothetical protein
MYVTRQLGGHQLLDRGARGLLVPAISATAFTQTVLLRRWRRSAMALSRGDLSAGVSLRPDAARSPLRR